VGAQTYVKGRQVGDHWNGGERCVVRPSLKHSLSSDLLVRETAAVLRSTSARRRSRSFLAKSSMSDPFATKSYAPRWDRSWGTHHNPKGDLD